ncbi:YlbF family regulator [Fonticella tunisiensis]|uniref:UPF0342 protein EDD71_105161 n=1 Tax=Fonticella tunisiensis TaxID=1096341 RepID=A0A4R7KRH4_9CLOT|nr:YlbF family regulator [Fonticella tunisiensis]TDT61981.1 cell fate (sporulation/competence/biofilm development) regulator YlbF (YheA/YmcA/DUF963 family) [Fonticella tunisiensis]
MSVYDKAHELARALKVAPEVVEYKRALDKIKANEKNKKMVDDFRNKQIEMYKLKMEGKEPSKEQMDAINNLMGIISLNSDIREFLGAEMRFSRLWEDIMKILGDAVDIDLDFGQNK